MESSKRCKYNKTKTKTKKILKQINTQKYRKEQTEKQEKKNK